MASVLKLKKADVVGLLVGLGFDTAPKMNDARILKKVRELDTHLDEDTVDSHEDLDKGQKKLAKSILKAIEDKTNVLVETSPPKEEPAKKAVPPAKGGKKAKVEEPEEESDEAEPEEDEEGSEEEEEKPSKKKVKGDEKPAKAGKAKGEKKVGVIATIIDLLKRASAKRPVSKDDITSHLVEKFPERTEKAMKSTVNSQVPSGLKAEKGIILGKGDEGGFWIEKNPNDY